MNRRPSPQPAPPLPRSPHRRGVVIVLTLVAIVALGLAVAGSFEPLAHEAETAAGRVESARAFYAAESGALIALGALAHAGPIPEPGDEIALPFQTVRFLEVPAGAGDLVTEGVSGAAARRVRLQIE